MIPNVELNEKCYGQSGRHWTALEYRLNVSKNETVGL